MNELYTVLITNSNAKMITLCILRGSTGNYKYHLSLPRTQEYSLMDSAGKLHNCNKTVMSKQAKPARMLQGKVTHSPGPHFVLCIHFYFLNNTVQLTHTPTRIQNWWLQRRRENPSPFGKKTWESLEKKNLLRKQHGQVVRPNLI